MKNSLLLSLIAILLCSVSTQAKNIILEGTIVDQNTHTPLDFATITIMDAESKAFIAGETTNAAGVFSLKIPTGTYDIKIDFLGFKTLLIEQQTLLQNHNMGTLSLAPDVAQLAEVEVTGERTTVEYKLDKKIFNVGKDLVAQGGAITDVLDNVPSVSVDAGGGISLRGNANVRILINGKPSVLTANNGLEQLPADMIERVEVITNPSARYEASGTAGIINIVMKKNKDAGFGASLQLTTGVPAHHRANVNMNYKTEKFNVFSNVGYRYSNYFGEGTFYENVPSTGTNRILNQTEDQDRNDDHYNIYFGGDYYFNDKNTLTTSFYHNKVVNTDETTYTYEFSNPSGTVDSLIERIEHYREPQNFNQLEMEYVKTFDNKDEKFTTSLMYDFWNDDENENITQEHLMPSSENISRIKSRDIESSKDLLIQSDYVKPLSETARFETGIRAEIRRITSDYEASINDEVIDQYNNELDYDERIVGAYVQYGNRFKKINYLLGLRSEYSDIGIQDRENSFSDTKDYIRFFPTAHFTYRFSQMMNVQLGYSRRINRPSFWQINPFGGLSDDRHLFVGNPDLNPMYTDAFELGILKRWEKLTLNPSIYYQRSTDFFQFITSIDELGNFLTKPVNLSEENRMGAELSVNYTPTKWLRLSSDFNYYSFEQKGDYQDVNYDTEDDTWSLRVNARTRFNKGLTMQSSFRYQGQNQSGQQLIKAQHSLDFSISKDLFKDKASLALNFRNLLDSRVRERIIHESNYELASTNKRIGRRFSATFTYRLNRKKNQRDRMPG